MPGFASHRFRVPPPSPTPTEPQRLRNRAGQAAGWIGFGFAANLVLRLGGNLVLTRLLAPEYYGLMAVCNVVIGGVALMSDMGITQTIIRSPHADNPRFLNTLWLMQVGRGMMMSLFILLAAAAFWAVGQTWPGLLPGTYGDPHLPLALAVLALVPTAAGLESTNSALSRRDLSLGPVVRNEVLAQTGSTALMMLAAWIWPSAWVLPAGWFLLAAFKALLSHLLIRGPGNRFEWDREHFRDTWTTSRWIMLSSGLTFLHREGDKIVLGLLVNSATLGLYAIGTLLVGVIQQVVNRLATFVGMPALAEKMRTAPQEVGRFYRKCRLPLDVVCLGTAGLLFTGADTLIHWLYDPRYQAAQEVLRILSLSLIATRFMLFDQYLMATGEGKELFRRSLARAVALYLIVPIGFFVGGLQLALVGIVISQFAGLPVILRLKAQRGLLSWRYELGVLPLFALGAGLGLLLERLHP